MIGLIIWGIVAIVVLVILGREIWLYASPKTRYKCDWRLFLGAMMGLLAIVCITLICILGEPCID